MTALATAFVEIRPDTAKFGPELAAKTSQAADRAGADSGSKFSTRFGHIMKVGAGVAAAGAVLAVGAFTKGAIKLEAEFGKTMNVLQATTHASGTEMKSLSALAMKMGADTVFSASDASKAMLELARGGIGPAQIQAGALKGTLTLAAAGELQMGEAANIAVRAMGAFNLKGKDMGSVAAALAGAANASSSSVRDMSIALAQGGLAASNVGFSIQETTGILAAFSKAGLEGSDAGTSLKTMLTRLIPTTDKAKDAMKEVGLWTERGGNAFTKANGEFESATTIAARLHQAMDGLSAAERAKALNTIFGSDAQRAATILAREGAAGLVPLIKATSDQSAAEQLAAANMKGTSGALERMHGSIETVQLAWGRAIKPVTIFGANLVTTIANGAVPIIEDFGVVVQNALSNFDFSGITNAMKTFDLGATLSSMGSALQNLAPSIRDIGASLQGADWGAFKDAFGKGVADTVSVFSVVIGFAADHVDELAKALPFLITGFLLYKAAQATANVLALASIPIQIGQIAAGFALASANRSLAAATLISAGAERASLVARAMGVTTTIAATTATVAAAAAQRIIAGVSRAWAAAQWVLNAAMAANPIGLVVVAIAALVVGLIYAYKHSETFRNIVNSAFTSVRNVVARVVGWLGSWVPGVFARVVAVVRGYVNLYRAVVTTAFNVAKAVVTAAVNVVRANVSRAFAVVRAVVSAVAGAVRAAMSAISGALRAAGAAASAFASMVRNKIGQAISFIRSIPGKARSALGNLGGILIHAGEQLISGLITGIQHKINDAVNAVKAGLSKIRGMLPGSPIKTGPLKSWNNTGPTGPGGQLIGLIISGMESQIPKLATAMAGVSSTVSAPVSRLESRVVVPALAGGGVLAHRNDPSSGRDAPLVHIDKMVTHNPAEAAYQLRRVQENAMVMSRLP